MRRFFLWIALLATVVVTACSDAYDDSELRKELDALADRVARLEQLCQQMNTNISSLQGLITALQQQDYITSVAPITQNGMTIGYVISFAKGEPITIYHGQDGTSSSIPVIGVKQDVDGIYYWTLNGEWLTNEKGEKVRAEGIDGVTPQLKIENGCWMVSYNGTDWTTLGEVTGELGQAGHRCNIVAVTFDAEYVYITLADGTTLTLPRVATGVLSIIHTNKAYTDIPSFMGSDISGMIYWGDGESETWTASATHLYSGAAPYQVTYELKKAETVTIHSLSGLQEVDFSKF